MKTQVRWFRVERNDVVIDREAELDEDNINTIVDSGAQYVLLHRGDQNLSDYAIIYNTLQKDPSNSEKEAVLYIYRQLRNADPADEDKCQRGHYESVLFRETLRFGRCGALPDQSQIESVDSGRHKGVDEGGHHRNHQIPYRADQLQGGC